MKAAKHFFVFLLCAVMMSMVSDVAAQAKANTLPPGTYKTIFEMLKDVPGLEVTTTSDKSGGSVTIRGIGSLRNQKNPLIVVDGAIYGGDISTINPQDVEGISILKDAASATAYGAQGAAGVIVINTKKGMAAAKQVSVKSYNGSAYNYFIQNKTMLKVIGFEDEIIVQGVPQKQKENSLVFMVKKKELLVPIINIKKVEMIQQ